MKLINIRKLGLLFICSSSLVACSTQKDTLVASDPIDDCVAYNLDSSCVVPVKKTPPRTNFIKDEIVLLYPGDKVAGLKRLTQKYHLKTEKKVVLSSINKGMLRAKTRGQNPLALSATINKKEKDVSAATNNTYQPAATKFRNAYSMYETGVRFVHKTTKGKGVTICMIDTPVDIFHPTLSNAVIDTLDIIDFDPKDSETMLHGTSVAGVLVSQNEHIGIAPQSKLYAVSAFRTTKSRPYILQGTSADIAQAIDSCIQHQVDVINLSFTGGKDDLLEAMITKAVDKGIVVVAAGGNGGHWGSTIYPALIPGVMGTTAVDVNKQLFSKADKGRFIDYSAPGVDILTIAPGGKYTLATGTSLSSAHLSGIVALLLSQKLNKQKPTNKAIDETLKKTAIDLGKPGRDQEYGEGLVSASRALSVLTKKH